MTFPSRGCLTCKQRRVKCDEAQPVCKRCQKANVACRRTQESGNFVFLNENEYAVGRRKRPRGPNTASRQGKESHLELAKPDGPSASVEPSNDVPFLAPLIFSISPTLNVSLEDQAINYYSTYYCEVPHGWPEIVDNHIMFALANFQPQSQSILNFAIHAVSHATFGRARRSQTVLAAGSTQYSKALAKINVALRDPSLATHDEVLLAAMLLSFYENSVTQKRSPIANRDLQLMAARSFTHHDGAMALLRLRRQSKQHTDWSMKIDKLTRRQLLRSLLLRCLPIPGWLRDGSLFGEYGLALKMDRYIVIAAKLRHQASNLRISTDVQSIGSENVENLRYLLAEAQKLDDVLAMWADEVPREDWYGSRTVEESGQGEPGNRIFCKTVHVYPTVGHVGLWNRYRGVRLVVNDAMLKTLNVLARASEPATEPVEEAARLRIKLLAEDVCASLPYVLGLLVEKSPVGSGVVIAKTPASLKAIVKASRASLLCWPLTITTMVDAIPERHRRYLKARLLDVSELVDDGLLERVATA